MRTGNILPAEILTSILDYVICNQNSQHDLPLLDHASRLEGLSDQQTLLAATRVCRAWRLTAERVLYRNITLYDFGKARKLLESLQAREELGTNTHNLRIHFSQKLLEFGCRTISQLLLKLPSLRRYSFECTALADAWRDLVVPLDGVNTGLISLRVVLHPWPLEDRSRWKASAYCPPRSIEKADIRGIDVLSDDALDLPRLEQLTLDRIALNAIARHTLSKCPNLKHVVLHDPDQRPSVMIFKQLGSRLETLELNYENPVDGEPLEITQETMRPLSGLQAFTLRGDFFADEFLCIPKSIQSFCWRSASDAPVINDFLEALSDPSFLPNLVEFPVIYMPEEARYRYPSVRKVTIKKATEALLDRGIKPAETDETSVWNEKKIFPRKRPNSLED